jgi:hypothetical protein
MKDRCYNKNVKDYDIKNEESDESSGQILYNDYQFHNQDIDNTFDYNEYVVNDKSDNCSDNKSDENNKNQWSFFANQHALVTSACKCFDDEIL